MTTNRRRHRWLTSGVALLAVSTMLAGCGNDSPASADPAGTAVPALDPANPVTVKVINTSTAFNVALAKDYGFFRKYGLDIQESQLANGTQVLAALQGGSGEIGYADLYAGINAKAQGFDIKLVANNNTNAEEFPILVKADGPIKSPADLAGRSIALPPVPQHTVNLRGFLKSNGVDPNAVKYTIVQSQSAAPQALAGGSVDAFFGQWIQAYSNEGQPGAYDFRVLGDPDSSKWSNLKATTAAFWVTGDWLKDPKNQAVAYAFDKALHASYVWFKTLKPEQLQPILLRYQKTDLQKITGNDPKKVHNLLTNTQTGPFDFDATQSWYQLGLEYAPDKIQKGVDLRQLVYGSALQPAPELIQPPENPS
ncbi:ABC transporter substrate-binding protein [Streptosporangium saharense]|uniref:NitT/TauT family transport system substrate-binding protein n=1 Tax=Streptosporangium saharense TaxID=1706840 RepID=A0A7W7VQT2_9ACTN|nr:ABC transporter substrate-binding protein [Streptosporangium saharense]MBB4919048.1 NitT/TauT family transport system substrate-binding protein [Streptosporangium saharense]